MGRLVQRESAVLIPQPLCMAHTYVTPESTLDIGDPNNSMVSLLAQ
jgi:hypothetical protein